MHSLTLYNISERTSWNESDISLTETIRSLKVFPSLISYNTLFLTFYFSFVNFASNFSNEHLSILFFFFHIYGKNFFVSNMNKFVSNQHLISHTTFKKNIFFFRKHQLFRFAFEKFLWNFVSNLREIISILFLLLWKKKVIRKIDELFEENESTLCLFFRLVDLLYALISSC